MRWTPFLGQDRGYIKSGSRYEAGIDGAILMASIPECTVDTHGHSPWHFTVQASLDLNPVVLAT